jgi:hypothetical protein
MKYTTILIVLCAAVVLYTQGCFDAIGGSKGQQSMQPTIDSKACYADAQQQLSPQWANASKLDRAIAAFTVITTCEGNQP